MPRCGTGLAKAQPQAEASGALVTLARDRAKPPSHTLPWSVWLPGQQHDLPRAHIRAPQSWAGSPSSFSGHLHSQSPFSEMQGRR